MRNLKTSDISTSIAFPVKSGTLDHLQLAYKEAFAEAVKGYIGAGYSTGTMYILNGLVNSGSGSNYIVTAGSVFYNGEVYLVDAATFTLTGANVAIAALVVTYFTAANADAVQFTDGIARNVHEIRKVSITQGLAGSGLANYISLVRINANIPQLNLIAGTGVSVTGTYPNITVASTITNKILKTGSIFIGDLNSTADLDGFTTLLAGSSNSISGYLYTFPAALTTNQYVPMLTLGNQGHNTVAGFNDNYMCVVHAGQCEAAQMYFSIGTTETGNTQSLSVRYALISTL
jgi:hypothetical protein